jgi:flagellar biosynthesis GTPase FlhF
MEDTVEESEQTIKAGRLLLRHKRSKEGAAEQGREGSFLYGVSKRFTGRRTSPHIVSSSDMVRILRVCADTAYRERQHSSVSSAACRDGGAYRNCRSGAGARRRRASPSPRRASRSAQLKNERDRKAKKERRKERKKTEEEEEDDEEEEKRRKKKKKKKRREEEDFFGTDQEQEEGSRR